MCIVDLRIMAHPNLTVVVVQPLESSLLFEDSVPDGHADMGMSSPILDAFDNITYNLSKGEAFFELHRQKGILPPDNTPLPKPNRYNMSHFPFPRDDDTPMTKLSEPLCDAFPMPPSETPLQHAKKPNQDQQYVSKSLLNSGSSELDSAFKKPNLLQYSRRGSFSSPMPDTKTPIRAGKGFPKLSLHSRTTPLGETTPGLDWSPSMETPAPSSSKLTRLEVSLAGPLLNTAYSKKLGLQSLRTPAKLGSGSTAKATNRIIFSPTKSFLLNTSQGLPAGAIDISDQLFSDNLFVTSNNKTGDDAGDATEAEEIPWFKEMESPIVAKSNHVTPGKMMRILREHSKVSIEDMPAPPANPTEIASTDDVSSSIRNVHSAKETKLSSDRQKPSSDSTPTKKKPRVINLPPMDKTPKLRKEKRRSSVLIDRNINTIANNEGEKDKDKSKKEAKRRRLSRNEGLDPLKEQEEDLEWAKTPKVKIRVDKSMFVHGGAKRSKTNVGRLHLKSETGCVYDACIY
jgi:hypothetical protein